MTLKHSLPALHVRDTGPGTPRKPEKIQYRPNRSLPNSVLEQIAFCQLVLNMKPQTLQVVFPGIPRLIFNRMNAGAYKDIMPKAPSWFNQEEWANRPNY